MKYWRGWSFQVRLDKGDSCARHQRLLAAEGNSEDVNHYHLRLRLTLRREKAKSYSRMQNKNPLQGPDNPSMPTCPCLERLSNLTDVNAGSPRGAGSAAGAEDICLASFRASRRRSAPYEPQALLERQLEHLEPKGFLGGRKEILGRPSHYFWHCLQTCTILHTAIH